MTESTDEGMDDAFYSDKEETSDTKPESVDEEEAENPTALLPKSALGGNCKPGDKYTVEVVKEYDDEAEVKVLGHANKTESKPAMSSDDELNSMAEKY